MAVSESRPRLTIDMLVRSLFGSIFHPFVCWMMPLSLRATVMPWDHLRMKQAIGWAVFVTICWILGAVNRAWGALPARPVDLSEEVIVITGGAHGLGLLLAEVYGMRGAAVAVLDVNELENAEDKGIHFYRCDVSDRNQLADVANQIERELGPPTVLINNAGRLVGKALLDMSFDEVHASLSTNLVAHFYTLKTFLPTMLRRPNGGTIVTVSSVMGQLGASRLVDYAAAKAGLTMMHRSLEMELQTTQPNHKIRMVLVEPGQLDTPLFRDVATPNAFFAPIVGSSEAAKLIIAAIESGRSARLAFPLYARWTAAFHLLPQSLQRVALRVSGINEAMKTYTPKKRD